MLKYSQISLNDLQRPEPTSFSMAGVNITVYASDARTHPSDNLAVLRVAVRDAKRIALTSPTIGKIVSRVYGFFGPRPHRGAFSDYMVGGVVDNGRSRAHDGILGVFLPDL